MDGILNINKPKGITSFGVVSLIRRLTREKRVGHAGTLDPSATGVLPVCMGQGTRIVEYMADNTKAYRGEIEFGVVTDTYDAEGTVVRLGDASRLSKADIEKALLAYHGEIMQTAPIYSALKQQGSPLYELARAGEAVEPKSRLVTIHKTELLAWEPPVATVEITCGKGTYIRSIAYDLGEALGCGAHLKNLIRTQYGVFTIASAVSLSELETAFRIKDWGRFVSPIDIVLSSMLAVTLDEKSQEDIQCGRTIELGDAQISMTDGGGGALLRAYSLEGKLIAVLKQADEENKWRPDKVFAR